ncbi:hypothetical protein MKX03_025107 [Papaver bracteatum]|nr:hypothetical protein MKX03_025107 [Papaver bracteatum]
MTKVRRPVPRTFPPTYKWISNEATTSTAMNHNNIITTTTIDNNRSVLNSDHEVMIKNCLWSKSILFDETKGKEVEAEDENREKTKNNEVTRNSTTTADVNGFNVEDGTMKRGTSEDNYWDDLYIDDNLFEVLGDL